SRKDHAHPQQVGSHDENIAVGSLHAVTELLRENDQGYPIAFSGDVEAATTVYREACVPSGNKARAATGQHNAAPEVEIFRAEDRNDFPRRIGHHDLGWTVIADVGIRKLVDIPNARLLTGRSGVWPARNPHTRYLPFIGLGQWAGVEDMTD